MSTETPWAVDRWQGNAIHRCPPLISDIFAKTKHMKQASNQAVGRTNSGEKRRRKRGTRLHYKDTVCLISKILYLQCCHVFHSNTQLTVTFCVQECVILFMQMDLQLNIRKKLQSFELYKRKLLIKDKNCCFKGPYQCFCNF